MSEPQPPESQRPDHEASSRAVPLPESNYYQPADSVPGYGSPAYTPAPAAPTPTLSIISLVLGILGVAAGFVGFGLLFSIGAVVLGHLGQRREPGAKGFWLTGLITGYLGIAINVIVLAFLIIAFFALAGSVPMNYPN
jgi:hypothetical protein